MTELTLFEELVTSEAAIRADYIYRNQRFTYHNGAGPIYCDAANPDRGDTQKGVAAHMYDNFIHTYNFMFMDSFQHEKLVEAKICNTRDLTQDELGRLRRIFDDFASQHYKEDGQLHIEKEQVPQALKALYERVTAEIPLRHAGMALGSLFVELGRSDKWKHVTPNGVDFTRGEQADNVLERIHAAINGQGHCPKTSTFIRSEEQVEYIGGVKFPRLMIDGYGMKHTHLVTSTGHLIDLTDELRTALTQHIASGKPLNDFEVDIDAGTKHLCEYQQPIDAVGEEGKKSRAFVLKKLQGMRASANALMENNGSGKIRAPLLSMDVDIMTGLTLRNPHGDSELKTFRAFLASQGYKELIDLLPAEVTQNITALPDEASKDVVRRQLREHVAGEIASLKEQAGQNEYLKGLIERAGGNLEVMLPRIYEIADKAFMDEREGTLKHPASQGGKPDMYLTMGGTASGKGGLKKLAEKECGDDLVIASLDDARGDSDRYWLYPATDNHNDDYKIIEEFAKAERDLITRRALAGHYNLFIDGSGIPYEGRNDAVTERFKKQGYNVSVLAAQAPLYVNDPQKRRELSAQNKAPHDSARRLGDRFEEKLRTVPIEIVAEKHIGFPIASRNAARDKNVDRFMIEDVSGPVGSGYTLSYVLTLEEKDMRAIANLQGEALKEAITERGLVPDWVKLPKGPDRKEFYDAKVIRDNEDGTYRVEVITDIRQYVNMVQKGLLRRNAIGPEAWFDNSMRCDIEGHFKGEDGKLRLQSSHGVATTQWKTFHRLAATNRTQENQAAWLL